DILCLRSVHTDPPYVLAYLLRIGFSQRKSIGIGGEQRRCHLVDTLVGGLCRQCYGHDELKYILMMKCTLCIRISFFKNIQNSTDFFSFHKEKYTPFFRQ